MEPCETKDHTEHLFLDLTVAFPSFSNGSSGMLDGLATLNELAPKLLDEASVWISTGRSGLKYFRRCALKMSALTSSKACCSFTSQVKATSFFRRVHSGADLVDRSSENLDR